MISKFSRPKTLILLLSYLAGSLIIVSMIPSLTLVDPRIGVIPLANFEGYKPFQYRVLMPLIIRGIEELTPEFVMQSITDAAAPRIAANMKQQGIPEYKAEITAKYAFRSILYICLNIAVIFLLMIVLGQFADSFDFFPKTVSAILPLGLVIMMPVFYDYATFIYDFPHLLLFTLGLYLLFKQNWLGYLSVFTLGILNKETAILLTITFLFYYFGKLSRKLFVNLLLGQIVIFFTIKLVLYLSFINNPGVIAEWHLLRNLDYLANLSHYFRFEIPFKGVLMPFSINLPWPRGLNVLMFGLLLAFIIFDWRNKPVFLRKATIYFIILFILAITSGYINELRAYFDALPIIYLLSMMGVYRVYRQLSGILLKGRHSG